MQSRISDTTAAAEQVHIALLREAGIMRRVDLAAEMTSFAIAGAYTALRRSNPDADDLEISLRFAEQQYGPVLATRLRAVLKPQAGGYDIVS